VASGISPNLLAARVGQVNAACLDRVLRQGVALRVAQYAALARAPKPFDPGVTPIPPSGKVIGATEMYAATQIETFLGVNF